MIIVRHIAIMLLLAVAPAARLGAQDYAIDYVPARFGQYTNQPTWLNPAAAGWQGDLEAFLSNQRQGGSWSGVNTYYLNANIKLPGASLKQDGLKNVLGIRVHSDREGDFINRNRAYGLYAYHTRLNRKLNAAGALSLGMMNYFIQGTAITGSSSVTGLDADAGLWFYSDDYYLGLSGNQLFNTELQPFTEITRLKRYYHMMGGYTYQLLDYIAMRGTLLVRLIENNQWDGDAGLLVIVDQFYAAGANFQYKRGLTFMAGTERLKLEYGQVTAMLSYSLPFASTLLNITTYEICLVYYLTYKP